MSDQVSLLSKCWDSQADEWIRWARAGQDSYERFHRDAFFQLVPEPESGWLTIDVGCGEGRVGRDLQERGHRMLGIDISFTMSKAAVTHPDDPTPAVTADAAKLPLADDSADCAIAFMSLQDIDNMPAAIKEVARVLKTGQHFVLAIVHPMYSGGSFLKGGANGNFVIDRSYFLPKRCDSADAQDDLTMIFHREHRPLAAYTKALANVGFVIEQLHEVTDEDPEKPWHRIPMFLDIRASLGPKSTAQIPDTTPQAHASHIVSHHELPAFEEMVLSPLEGMVGVAWADAPTCAPVGVHAKGSLLGRLPT